MALFEIKSKFKDLRNSVMQLTPIEIKVRECTSNDSWGAKVSDKQEVAEATYNYEDFKLIMGQLWKRMQDTGKDWRHVFKGLQLLEYLVANGSERVLDEAKDQIYTIRALKNFQYVDEKGKDQGAQIRDLSKKVVAFLQDDKAIEEEREKAKAMKDKFEGFSRTEARSKVSKNRSTSSKSSRPSHAATKASYDDYDEDEDDRPVRKAPTQQHRRNYEDDEEDSRPTRATSYDNDDSSPVPKRKISNVRVSGGSKPRPPSFEMDRQPSRQQQQQQQRQPQEQPKQKETDLMDMFFDSAPVAQQSRPQQQQQQQQQQDPFADPFGSSDVFAPSNNNNFGTTSGFNPRSSTQPQDQGGFQNDFDQGFEANFGGNDQGFEADFDDNFGEQKKQPQQNELFNFTQGLVDLSLSGKDQKRKDEMSQPEQKQGPKMTIGELKKLKEQQGMGATRSFTPVMSPNQPQQQRQSFPQQQQQQFQQNQGYPQQQQQFNTGYPPQQYPQQQQQFQQNQGYPQQQQRAPQQQQNQGFSNDPFF